MSTENRSWIEKDYGGRDMTSAEMDYLKNIQHKLSSPRVVCDKCGEVHENPENVYHAGPVGFEAMYDKILVLEDEFRSGYECDKCDATGKLKCPDCDTGASRLNPDMTCKSCHGGNLVDCPDCKGKGALLVIADTAQRRPTTGRVVSIGSETSGKLRRGDAVLYPSFCGEVMDLKGADAEGREIQIVVRMLKEKETVSRVTGRMELRRVSKQQFNVGG